MIYFDNAATSGVKPISVINATNFALKNLSANPGRSGHNISQKTAMAVYNARNTISDFFGANGPENVVFTANCTQSINYVLKGVLNSNDHIIISDLEHNAVMRPLIKHGVKYSVANVYFYDDKKTVENFRKLIKPNTKMIFCTCASNVIGYALPIKEIGELCQKNNLLFGVDAAQGGGVLKIDMKQMKIDYLCAAPHKSLYAPMGLGILIANKSVNNTIIEGGTGTESINLNQPNSLPEMLESGTVNVPGIIGCEKGIEFVKNKIEQIYSHEMQMINLLNDELGKSDDIELYFNHAKAASVPVLSFNYKDVNSDDFCDYLNKSGFALRAGLHCAPTAHKKIGTIKKGTVRFSPSYFNNFSEVKMLINVVKKYKKYKNNY